MEISQLLTFGGTVIGFLGGVVAVYFTFKGTKLKTNAEVRTAEVSREVEAVRADAISKAERVKIDTEAETRRIDQMMDFAMDRIKELQIENKDQRKEMSQLRIDNDATRTKLDVCLTEKTAEAIEAAKRIANLEEKTHKMEKQFEMTARYLNKEDEILNIQNGDTIKPNDGKA